MEEHVASRANHNRYSPCPDHTSRILSRARRHRTRHPQRTHTSRCMRHAGQQWRRAAGCVRRVAGTAIACRWRRVNAPSGSASAPDRRLPWAAGAPPADPSDPTKKEILKNTSRGVQLLIICMHAARGCSCRSISIPRGCNPAWTLTRRSAWGERALALAHGARVVGGLRPEDECAICMADYAGGGLPLPDPASRAAPGRWRCPHKSHCVCRGCDREVELSANPRCPLCRAPRLLFLGQ